MYSCSLNDTRQPRQAIRSALELDWRLQTLHARAQLGHLRAWVRISAQLRLLIPGVTPSPLRRTGGAGREGT